MKEKGSCHKGNSYAISGNVTEGKAKWWLASMDIPSETRKSRRFSEIDTDKNNPGRSAVRRWWWELRLEEEKGYWDTWKILNFPNYNYQYWRIFRKEQHSTGTTTFHNSHRTWWLPLNKKSCVRLLLQFGYEDCRCPQMILGGIQIQIHALCILCLQICVLHKYYIQNAYLTNLDKMIRKILCLILYEFLHNDICHLSCHFFPSKPKLFNIQVLKVDDCTVTWVFWKTPFFCCLFVHMGIHNNENCQLTMTNTILQK